ncbi:signal peptidase I [Anseongella ginsenosidimutans]|uniref:Signal peptidase I n=1 Tax=Anseongella ginsenosidimutans TaxID=496056 RepID=A0A4R3KNL0_9SPHI|nr:signal peptidase I [Anseongella ginsenosidimutans]QEC53574.1 signal peptidase I [Anseongella ginsenosidimutans]TCS84644.1 signal peptidase I [Anseongella ginsenosidimutans]
MTRPLVAFLLSFLVTGLGQLYNGQLKKAVILFLLLLLIPFLFGAARFTTNFSGYTAMLAIMLGIWLYGISDAIIQARRRKEYAKKKYNRWYVYLFIGIVITAATWFYEKAPISGMQHFIIVSPSQLPTMQLGDRVLADIHAYREKQPDYGQIVVFNQPGEEVWCFRVAGLPGDTIQVIDDILVVNGVISESRHIRNVQIEGVPVQEYEEKMVSGHKHRIYSNQKAAGLPSSSSDKIVVPDNCYYLLGDNRGNALDSRYIGPVSADNILGQVLFSIWGRSYDRVNVDFRNR